MIFGLKSLHRRSVSVNVAPHASPSPKRCANWPNSKVSWRDLIADYDRIRDKIEEVYPEFEDYNARIRRPGGFRLPLGPTERIWHTQSGKAEFIPFTGLAEDPALQGKGILKLTTIRSHDQYNTTVYGLDDRYRGVFGRRDVLFMSEADLLAQGIEHGDLVEIEIERIVWQVEVLGVCDVRGPASVAQTLYAETEESKVKRQVEQERRKTYREPAAALHGRPTKRDRRTIDKLSGGD